MRARLQRGLQANPATADLAALRGGPCVL